MKSKKYLADKSGKRLNSTIEMFYYSGVYNEVVLKEESRCTGFNPVIGYLGFFFF